MLGELEERYQEPYKQQCYFICITGTNIQGSFPCDICNRRCTSLADYQDHLQGKAHIRKSTQLELSGGCTETNTCKPKNVVVETVDQVNDLVVALLTRLNELQHASMVRHKDEKVRVVTFLSPCSDGHKQRACSYRGH